MKILIADDSIVSRHLLEATLRKWEYDVVIASDGAEAWEILQRPDAPSIAILDWVMPGLTGPEVCRNVRQRAREPYTYLLLLTSKSLKEDLVEGMESGADDYLVKPFDQHELKVRLRAGRRIVELQIELLRAREILREQATRDFLTGLWNRSSILEILERELIRGERERRPVGVVLADLDHFKQVNDTHGHFAGDAVLREAARRMVACCRPYDSIGRYGGEELLVILPGCNGEDSSHQAERMRLSVCGDPLMLSEAPYQLTCSFGAAWAEPGRKSTSEQLIRAADDALYRAKNQGRNLVVLAPTLSALATQ
ncbi:MAG: diguanylate cyclase [Bryobacteraceae bacterium]|nr:diguanylate cyclase [Bryobacteraceae bacterium]